MQALYRRFSRSGLQAVDYNFPQRYVLQKVSRSRFEDPSLGNWAAKAIGSTEAKPFENPTPAQIQNTSQFFEAAAENDGVERRCLSTMIHYYASKHNQRHKFRTKADVLEFDEMFMATIVNGVNQTQNMCL